MDAEEADFAPLVEWWREAAIPLMSWKPGEDPRDLREPVGLIGDAKIVGLGESSHGAGELFTMKHRLIAFLVADLGFTACAFEASHSGSLAIDDYVCHGDGEAASALTGQGYAAWDTEEVLALLEWLRDHNAAAETERAVAFWGFDSGYNAAGRGIVGNLSRPHGSRACRRLSRPRLRPLIGWSRCGRSSSIHLTPKPSSARPPKLWRTWTAISLRAATSRRTVMS